MEKKAQKKMKRLIVIVSLLLMAAAALSAGHFEAPVRRYEVRQDLSVYFSNSDEVIDSIRSSLKNRSWRIVINFRSHGDNMTDIPALAKDLMSFAADETSDPAEGDYIYHQYGGYEVQYSSQPDGDTYFYTVYIYPDYYTDSSQEEMVDERLKSVIDGFGFDGRTTDYEKMRAVYEFVIENTDYDIIHKKNDNHHLKSTAFGALIYGKATCQGYAVLTYRLLREAGVGSRVITGTAKYDGMEEYHAWNIVCIDGLYYNLDVTWDDQNGSEDNFLKSDSDFAYHIRDEQYATEDFYGRYPMAEQSFCRE